METISKLEQKALVAKAIDDLVDFINEANIKYYTESYPMLKPDPYMVDGGRKYIKIVRRGEGQGGYVHCFVDSETADVYKPASWKAPMLNGARFNILDDASFADLKTKWDPHGDYLYKNWK